MSQGEVTSERQARAILQLAADDPPSTWRAAFQRGVKAAHPDAGGDEAQVRLVIDAYRYLKTTEGTWRRHQAPPRPATQRPRPRPQAQAKPKAAPEPPPQAAAEPPQGEAERPAEPVVGSKRRAKFQISIVDAFQGCDRTVRLKTGKRFKVRLPPGLQSGDVVRFGDEGQHRLAIEVKPMAGAELKGADLWLTVAVSGEFLKEGGRMEVETPMGPRKFWVSRTSASRGLYRAPKEGLPERPGRARGHLYLKFELDETLKHSPAKSLLARFAAVWAAE